VRDFIKPRTLFRFTAATFHQGGEVNANI